MFTGYLNANMLLLILGEYIIPKRLIIKLEKSIGWNLYAKSLKK
jgi:hypothetical protein